MKKLMIVAAVFCTAFASCQGPKNIKSYTALDSMAYAYGVYVGSDFKRNDSTLNAAAFAVAFQDHFAGKAAMTTDEAYAFLNEWFQVRQPAKLKAENEAWLKEVKAGNPNIQTTESGLMYEIITPGDDAVKAMNDADQVMVNYRGTLKDGSEFDANDSISFPLNRVIPGWSEGLKLVGKGGEITLWIPSEIGYGAQGSGPIPPNSALKFDVKLLDVTPAPAAE